MAAALPTAPSLTFSGSGVWTVIAGAVGNAAAITLSAPTNYTTNFRNDVGDDTFDTSVGLGYRTDPVSPEDPGVMTDSGAGVAWCAVTMALLAAVAAPPEPYFWGLRTARRKRLVREQKKSWLN